MPTSYCPECGAEYVEGVDECTDCQVPLVPRGLAAADSEDVEEVVYELDDWEPQERTTLSRLLTSEGIPHQWEGDGELVVREGDADRVETLLDEVEGAGELVDELDGDDDGSGDEVPYEVVSDLFLAADRLLRAPDDPALVGDLVVAAEAVSASVPPYGVAPEEWARIKGLAASVRHDVAADADPDLVAQGARNLREVLARYV